MSIKIPRLNNHGHPYLPLPEEVLVKLANLEDPTHITASMHYDQYLLACGEYASLYEWVESYHYEQHGPVPEDEEFDPEHIRCLFERLNAVAELIYASEKAPQLTTETLARNTPSGASNAEWALYAMSTDPISIGSIDGNGFGYPLLLRQLSVAGARKEALLVYAPTWFPAWLHDKRVRLPHQHLGPNMPSPEELDTHTAALKLWSPHRTAHVFHDYRAAYSAVRKSWQRPRAD